ncbi:hypothetical protein Nepgr_027066 [Nepenthes gracilis]|uniref:Uncharacterized protein n=1 Tax=Nepenthes gracilis TaxID=150966 RepID=A0AAD3T9P9_NEPGR|nr:hypothetical protein Nepgr_027066 [Nepenthes gracilis]
MSNVPNQHVMPEAAIHSYEIPSRSTMPSDPENQLQFASAVIFHLRGSKESEEFWYLRMENQLLVICSLAFCKL